MFKIDHMGFFSVPHNMDGCLSGKKKLGTMFGKKLDDEASLGQIEKLL